LRTFGSSSRRRGHASSWRSVLPWVFRIPALRIRISGSGCFRLSTTVRRAALWSGPRRTAASRAAPRFGDVRVLTWPPSRNTGIAFARASFTKARPRRRAMAWGRNPIPRRLKPSRPELLPAYARAAPTESSPSRAKKDSTVRNEIARAAEFE
jgi:hypothetical protein